MELHPAFLSRFLRLSVRDVVYRVAGARRKGEVRGPRGHEALSDVSPLGRFKVPDRSAQRCRRGHDDGRASRSPDESDEPRHGRHGEAPRQASGACCPLIATPAESQMPEARDPTDRDLETAVAMVRSRLIPFLFLLYIVAYLDRINVGFASLQMNQALGFSDATYGLGAGIFFVGYTLFEIPSNVILARVGARLWIARIMITWGLVSAGMMFVRSAPTFYVLRFLLGLAEAGFFPGIIYYLTRWVPARERARTIAAFMTATLVAGVIGGPLSGALLTLQGAGGLAGWQWLFLLEGLPAIVLGFVVLRVMTDRPEDAMWLRGAQKAALLARIGDEERQALHQVHSAAAALRHPRLWLLSVIYFTVPVALYAFGFFLPQIIQNSFRGSTFEVGLLSAVPDLAGTIAVVIA